MLFPYPVVEPVLYWSHFTSHSSNTGCKAQSFNITDTKMDKMLNKWHSPRFPTTDFDKIHHWTLYNLAADSVVK
jgi:hypothetical protein